MLIILKNNAKFYVAQFIVQGISLSLSLSLSLSHEYHFNTAYNVEFVDNPI